MLLLMLLQQYFSANEQCFSLTINQHKQQYKPNFSETNRASRDFGYMHVLEGMRYWLFDRLASLIFSIKQTCKCIIQKLKITSPIPLTYLAIWFHPIEFDFWKQKGLNSLLYMLSSFGHLLFLHKVSSYIYNHNFMQLRQWRYFT